jgi:hypothetical protein
VQILPQKDVFRGEIVRYITCGHPHKLFIYSEWPFDCAKNENKLEFRNFLVNIDVCSGLERGSTQNERGSG